MSLLVTMFKESNCTAEREKPSHMCTGTYVKEIATLFFVLHLSPKNDKIGKVTHRTKLNNENQFRHS